MPARKKKSAKKPKKKTTGQTTAPKSAMPAKIPQAHGGALNSGGTPGNAGGTGRPKSEVRAAALAGADKAIPKLLAIVEDETSQKSEVIAAGDKLLKYGLGTQTEVSVEDIKHRLTRQMEFLRERLSAAVLDGILPGLHSIWSGS